MLLEGVRDVTQPIPEPERDAEAQGGQKHRRYQQQLDGDDNRQDARSGHTAGQLASAHQQH